MGNPLEILRGRRDRFAVKIAFLPDPHHGEGGSPEQSLSWGGLEIWVNGYNVCGHVEMNERIEAVHWYLLLFLQWLATNWDFLLHEERFPARNAASDAWLAMRRTAEAPSGLDDQSAEKWEIEWHRWWQRHCILASRDGGLLPALFLRRLQDMIELSWGDRPIAGAPSHFRFNANHGSALLNPEEVASVLFEVLDCATRHLLTQMPDSPTFIRLVKDVERLQHSDRRRRLGLLSGQPASDMDPIASWDRIKSFFPSGLAPDIADAVLLPDDSDLVTLGSSQAALMFGSLSPTVDEWDARLLAEKLLQYYKPGSESLRLRNLAGYVPIEGGNEVAWSQGYALAEEVLEKLGEDYQTHGHVDIDKVYSDLSIAIDEVHLHDKAIRAVAVAGPNHQPVVLVNGAFEYQDIEPRRFTLAHELCHLLHDRCYAARLAMASGPWAPLDVERRANAFAAMFLMPTELLANAIRRSTSPLDNPASISEVATRMQTSFTSTLEHLCNLGYLDEAARDFIRAMGLSRASQNTRA